MQGPKLQPPSQILAPSEPLLLPPPLPTNAISPDILRVEIWRGTRYSEGERAPFLVIGAARRQMARKMARNRAGLEPRPSFGQTSRVRVSGGPIRTPERPLTTRTMKGEEFKFFSRRPCRPLSRRGGVTRAHGGSSFFSGRRPSTRAPWFLKFPSPPFDPF